MQNVCIYSTSQEKRGQEDEILLCRVMGYETSVIIPTSLIYMHRDKR